MKSLEQIISENPKDESEFFSLPHSMAREIFLSRGSLLNEESFNNFYNRLCESDKNKLLELSYFYYWICQPGNSNIREELRLVAITSMIESLMEKEKFKDFISWFKGEDFVAINSIDDFIKLEEQYFAHFGAAKKVKLFFELYVKQEDRDKILKNIERMHYDPKADKQAKALMLLDPSDPDQIKNYIEAYPYGKRESLSDINEFARLLYNMRSEFVHEARMQNLASSYSDLTCILVNGKGYTLNPEIGINELMGIFERSFVNFWQTKYATQGLSS